MSKHQINPPDGFVAEFVKKLIAGEVLIQGIGTFYLSSVVKNHPSRIKSKFGNGYKVRKRKITTVRFRPESILKVSL